jgi:hypothetical protein
MYPIFRSPSEVKEGEIYMVEDPFGPPHYLRKSNGSLPPQRIDDCNLIGELQYGNSSWAVEWRKRNYSSGLPDHRQLAANSGRRFPHQPQHELHQRPIPDNVRQFVLKHYVEAQKIAAQLGNGITAAEVLAVSGNESGWGNLDPQSSSKARYGNFFGLHGKGPAGTYWTTGKPSVPTPIFSLTAKDDGFIASGQEFVKLVKQKVILTPGIGDDPKAFFTALNKAHLYADGNAQYAADMIAISPRGSYEAVRQCIVQLKQEGKL